MKNVSKIVGSLLLLAGLGTCSLCADGSIQSRKAMTTVSPDSPVAVDPGSKRPGQENTRKERDAILDRVNLPTPLPVSSKPVKGPISGGESTKIDRNGSAQKKAQSPSN